MKNFFFVLMYALISAVLIGSATGINPYAIAGVVAVGAYVPIGAHSFASGLSLAGYVPDQKAPLTQENMGGYGSRVLIIPIDWLVSAPILTNTPATPEEMVATTVPIVMKDGKYAIDGYCTRDKSEADPEGQGEADGKSMAIKGKFFIPNVNSVESSAQARYLQAPAFLCIYPADNGEYKLFGSMLRPCYAVAKGKSGVKASDSNGYLIEWDTDMYAPGIFYRAALPLDPATNPQS